MTPHRTTPYITASAFVSPTLHRAATQPPLNRASRRAARAHSPAAVPTVSPLKLVGEGEAQRRPQHAEQQVDGQGHEQAREQGPPAHPAPHREYVVDTNFFCTGHDMTSFVLRGV